MQAHHDRSRGTRRRALAALAALTALAAACAPSNRPVLPPPEPRGMGPADDYVIGVPDRLELSVWEQPDLSGPLLVRRDGKVSVRLLGDVQAAGLTPEELADAIQEGLSEYLTAPRVDVAVTEMRSQIASVIGAGVVQSGIVELQRDTRVIDALAAMGGLTAFARKRDIRIIRETPEGPVEYPFDYTAFVEGQAPETNILLAPGDTIIVPE